MSDQRGPRVYRSIAAVAAALSRTGIAKRRHNQHSGYAFRGIDDIYNSLSPLLAKHKLCVLPRILERTGTEHRSAGGELIFSVWVHAAFDFVSAVDGSIHSVETFGEAMDRGDKATGKALSAAYKYAAMQAFCIPIAGEEDADASTAPLLTAVAAAPEQGWEGWAKDVEGLVTSCMTNEALDRLQSVHRGRLRSLSLADAGLYASLGEAIGERRAQLRRGCREAA